MNREQMLNHLAHTLPNWPDEYVDMIEPGHGWAWYDEEPDCTLVLCKGEEEIREADYAARRAELINKPSWEGAPEWAQWLAQDEDGEWWWYEDKPKLNHAEGCFDAEGRLESICAGIDDIAGHNWRDTLEKRPTKHKTCRHCDIEFRRPHVGGIPDDRCTRCDDEIKALWPEPDPVKTWWTSKTCTKCGHTTAAKVSDDAPVCPGCVAPGGTSSLHYAEGSDETAQNDPVNHPAHYQSDNGIECIDAIRAALGRDGFISYCRGNAIKYAWRSDRKGKAAEDKRKAAWYLERAARELEE